MPKKIAAPTVAAPTVAAPTEDAPPPNTVPQKQKPGPKPRQPKDEVPQALPSAPAAGSIPFSASTTTGPKSPGRSNAVFKAEIAPTPIIQSASDAEAPKLRQKKAAANAIAKVAAVASAVDAPPPPVVRGRGRPAGVKKTADAKSEKKADAKADKPKRKSAKNKDDANVSSAAAAVPEDGARPKRTFRIIDSDLDHRGGRYNNFTTDTAARKAARNYFSHIAKNSGRSLDDLVKTKEEHWFVIAETPGSASLRKRKSYPRKYSAFVAGMSESVNFKREGRDEPLRHRYVYNVKPLGPVMNLSKEAAEAAAAD